MPDTPIDIRPAPEHGAALAEGILAGVASARAQGRRYLLGCPTGRTPVPVYAAIARRLETHTQPLDSLVLVMMDEYLEPSPVGGYRYVSASAHNSCRRFAREEIKARWDAVLPHAHQLPGDNIWFPDPVVPTAYDARIAQAGGIDLFLLASGAGDGHIAFNPPGTCADTQTRIIALSEQTRRDNMATFPDFARFEDVPTHGVSVGIATIAAARNAVMLLFGADKATAFSRITTGNAYDPDWPATAVHLVPRRCIAADPRAAGRESQ